MSLDSYSVVGHPNLSAAALPLSEAGRTALESRAEAEADVLWAIDERFATDLHILTELPGHVAALVLDPASVGVVLTKQSPPPHASAAELLAAHANESPLPIVFALAEDTHYELNFPTLEPSAAEYPSDWCRQTIADFRPEQHFESITSRVDATALKAGLLQLHGDLDRSHSFSQSIEGEGRHHAGDYWHGIMHRREPDYGNAKYWFRRVGQHRVFTALTDFAEQIGGPAPMSSGRWDPYEMIDLCQQASRTGDPELMSALERLQFQEMLLLLKATCEDMLG